MKACKDLIIPYFQPVIAVDTRKIMGYEVLGRVQKRDGVYSLGPFFHDPAVPEDTKVETDRLIRQKALELVAAVGIKANVFLNIQPQWACSFLRCAELLPTLDYLQTYGIPGDQIVIEISEAGAFVAPEDLAELASRYREAGCKIALDDFGLQFNNLERIFSLKPDFLKISTALSGDTGNKALFCSLLRVLGLFARETGLELMLEGVETETQFLEGIDAGDYTRCGMGSWLIQDEYVGRNWCWRPYFLPCVVEAARKRQGILSAEYLDLESHRPIRTLVYPLSASRFLFIDLDLTLMGS